MYIHACTHAHKPCSGAYVCVVESSVVYSEDTIGRRYGLLTPLIVVDRVLKATWDWHSVGVLGTV